MKHEAGRTWLQLRRNLDLSLSATPRTSGNNLQNRFILQLQVPKPFLGAVRPSWSSTKLSGQKPDDAGSADDTCIFPPSAASRRAGHLLYSTVVSATTATVDASVSAEISTLSSSIPSSYSYSLAHTLKQDYHSFRVGGLKFKFATVVQEHLRHGELRLRDGYAYRAR